VVVYVGWDWFYPTISLEHTCNYVI